MISCQRFAFRVRVIVGRCDTAHHIIPPFPPRLSDVYFASRPSPPLPPSLFRMGESECSTHCQAIPAASEQRLQKGPQKATPLQGENEREGVGAADCHFNNKAQHCDPARLEREGGREAARDACVLAYLPAPFHAPCGAR